VSRNTPVFGVQVLHDQHRIGGGVTTTTTSHGWNSVRQAAQGERYAAIVHRIITPPTGS